jgi:redox-sensitive bicupin YhaK (pirin superfamily)
MIGTVISAARRSLGGFEVGRVLPSAELRSVGPFVFYDHMGPMVFPAQLPRSTDVRPHPHIGLSTVTYLFAGEIVHRDSLGVHQVIRPGEVNWMTAGRGISHSERFDTMRERGGPINGIQAWVALPESQEEAPPAFTHFAASDLPHTQSNGAELRVIAGSAFGLASPVATHSPLFYVHAELQDGASTSIPGGYTERAVYIARGAISVAGRDYVPGQMLAFRSGSEATLTATGGATVMLLGGESLGPRHVWWNFVSSRRERIEQAKDDWRAGRIPLPTGDDQEFIPLPE